MKIAELPTKKSLCQENSREFLLEAAEEGFESVVIVGLFPDGKVAYRNSRSISGLMLLGALEHAKMQVEASWDETPK